MCQGMKIRYHCLLLVTCYFVPQGLESYCSTACGKTRGGSGYYEHCPWVASRGPGYSAGLHHVLQGELRLYALGFIWGN